MILVNSSFSLYCYRLGWAKGIFSLEEERAFLDSLIEKADSEDDHLCCRRSYLERSKRRNLKNKLLLRLKSFVHVCFLASSKEVTTLE